MCQVLRCFLLGLVKDISCKWSLMDAERIKHAQELERKKGGKKQKKE